MTFIGNFPLVSSLINSIDTISIEKINAFASSSSFPASSPSSSCAVKLTIKVLHPDTRCHSAISVNVCSCLLSVSYIYAYVYKAYIHTYTYVYMGSVVVRGRLSPRFSSQGEFRVLYARISFMRQNRAFSVVGLERVSFVFALVAYMFFSDAF